MARPQVVPVRPPPGSMKAIRRGQPAAHSQGAAALGKPVRRLPLVPVAGATMLIAVIAILELRTLGGDGRSSEPPEAAVMETPHLTVAAAPSLLAPAQPPVATASVPVDAQPADAQAGSASEVPAVPTPKPVARKRSFAAEAVKTPSPAPSAVVEEPPPQVAAAPARRAETPRSDPLHSFNVALARCAQEDLMARVGCEQRVRLQFCGDFWGQIAQCSIGRPIDHGQ